MDIKVVTIDTYTIDTIDTWTSRSGREEGKG